jgi:MOSC domain
MASIHGQPGKLTVNSVNKDVWTPEQCKMFEMERFRPNIVIESFGEGRPLAAWEEDEWDAFEIGESLHAFYGVSRCARCTVRLPNYPWVPLILNWYRYRTLILFPACAITLFLSTYL